MIVCPETALIYTIPQTDKRSFGSTKAAATSAVDNLLLVHLMHGSTLVFINFKKSFRDHVGRSHLTRGQLTSCI